MAIKMNQSLKQTQSLMMTPQLQQAIKLLTLTHLEMTNLISQEMVENPMLEEVGGEANKSELENKDGPEAKEANSDDFNQPDIIEGARENFDWEKYVETYNSSSSSAPNVKEKISSEDQPNYENMVSRGQSLQDHLEWQLRMDELNDKEMDFALEFIHNLNEEGYLTLAMDEILAKSDLSREHAQEIITLIQALDPVGCGASDLKECLLIQAMNLEQRVPLVERIINYHLKDLEQKDYQQIQHQTGVGLEKIKDAEFIILGLNPKPGRLVSSDETHYVVPDIFVVEVGGEFVVQINDEGVPRLRVSKLYQSLLKNKETSEEAQDFVEGKLRSALWLIKSIENRQKTIQKVADSIVRNQQEFFKKGPTALKPMILKDVANEIGMHESTVSRVTTNKFMHTPIGTYELKYFFNVGIGGKNGGIDIAGESLKLKIKELVNNEDPKKPLSDQKISQLLSTRDIIVARRTVAKYREMMNIPSSSKRKKRKQA